MTDFTIIKKLFHITESAGFTNEEIQTVKNIFVVLPQVFVDYYNQLGKHQDLNHTQDSLVVPERFQYYQNNDYLIFYTENQHACVWGIHKDDLSSNNPPVYMSYDKEKWELEAETLLEFFTAMAFLQSGFALNFQSECFYEFEQEEIQVIVEKFKDKKVSFKQWTDGIKFYGNYDDDVIMVMNNNQIFYASNTENHFIEMNKILSELGTAL
ncbi:hypothetical protein [Flavobacterium branchiicola]|uniref:SMI1/KNR4 family protein n=1 Tax=Flavobacterium branchiicola TaxID=1114875 RepID=A0ABV9P9W4_9FLAO|nr:hypothetical protein [Flavobacterium branchiicola]MBS7252798.1 hypothetical protein [Flavobacterium branchiicola]